MSRGWNADRNRPSRRRHRRGRNGRLELAPERTSAGDDRAILEELARPPFQSPPQPSPPAPAAEPVPPAPPRPPSRDGSSGFDTSEARDPSTVSEDDDYDRARVVAERKAELYIDGGKKAIVVIVLLIVPPLSWLGFILAIVWGIKFARRYFSLSVEPGLRERLIEDEVQKEVHVNVSRERRSLEGEHSQSLEQLSASIAHEIRNPITAAKSLVQQIGEEPESPDNPEYARVAVEELARVERSITHLLRFARDEEMRVAEIRMVDVLESALETFRDRVARDGVEIVRNFDCDGVLEGDADKLRRIVINLLGNGIDALAEARVEQPRMEISLGENLAGSEVWVRIRDNGRGIDDELREKIFRPFVTSKPGGTGLGLPITKKLIESHGGTIELMSAPGEGAEFVLTIPKRGLESRGRP
jgi:signal transduction histidine kinase